MSSDTAPTAKRVIKRYSNRKLYDTRDSRYVTLQQIGEMVRQGEDVQIIDNKTKEDKTEVTLALILSEDLKNKPRSVPLNMLRTLIQERGERLLSSLREGPIGRLIPKTDETSEPEPAPVTDEAKGTKKRLNELVESSRHTLDQLQAGIDERVAAIVPGVGPFRELRAKVDALGKRLDAIEKKLGMSEGDGTPE